MKGMTAQERYDDISRRSGMSEDVVRRVLHAERESIIATLKKGERSTLIGRCVIRPDLRNKLLPGGKMGKQIRLTAEVSSALADEFKDLEDFETDDEDEGYMPGVLAKQIKDLI